MWRSQQGSRTEIRLTVYRPLVSFAQIDPPKCVISRLGKSIIGGFNDFFLKSQAASGYAPGVPK